MRFSVITCTYNSEQYLQKNINSVEIQTFHDFEHVFIDGFSTDATMAIIEKYRQKYPDKVKVFQSKPQGISHAMNEGIKRSSGDYLVHLHSDDSFYSDDTLEIVDVFAMQNRDPDWFYGKARIINAINQSTKIIPNRILCSKARFWQMLFLSNYIPHQSVFIKKSVFEKYGMFNIGLKKFMDYDLWLHLLKNRVEPLFIDEIICNFSIRDDSQSVVGRRDEENVILYKKYVKNSSVIIFLTLFDRMRRTVMHRMSVYKITQKKS